MIEKILVANRGEIAVRIFRTCREMGIGTLGVCSPVDGRALHTRACDKVIELRGNEPGESYLDGEQIIRAARDNRAQAIHPGYGFLAENGDFAKACETAGLKFIGPPSDVLHRVGDKVEARKIASRASVPVIPGGGIDQARQLGFPLMIKAAAGGGGKGMRVVERPEDLSEALDRAASEARAAFGDDTLYLEKLVVSPRHVEVQILADQHGNIVHLFERECSIQRRHQKIIEEAPSPGVDRELRESLGQAAIRVAREAGYQGAGTVEFLVTQDGSFYFMEVNARLQVEHPVSELITGLDLVEQQINIANSKPLGFDQAQVQRRGHALECRIYAEDPEAGFLPSPGEVKLLQEPAGPGVRFDCGVGPGSLVPVQYDPILAKLITWGADRDQAIRRMARALGDAAILGVKTPLEMLLDIVESPAFREGGTSTAFLSEHFPDWKPDPGRSRAAMLGWLAVQLQPGTETVTTTRLAQPDPWRLLGRFRIGE